MIKNPQDELESYFSDLLGDNSHDSDAVEDTPSLTSSTSASSPLLTSEVVLEPAPKPIVRQSRPVREPESRLQDDVREKLSRLLSPKPLPSQPMAAPPQALSAEATSTRTAIVKSPPELKTKRPVVAPSADVAPTVAIAETVSVQEEHLPEEDTQAWVDGRPVWAQSTFDVLLFEVAGLTLAVPLVSLGQIQPLTDELTPLFGQADWFMGLQPTPMGKIRTINTALFVMPERYQDTFIKGAKYVISIDGLPWGLAVDRVNQPISLAPDDVRWRSDRGKRPWLAGTVKQQMCALLDVSAMGKLLQNAEKDPSGRDPLKS